ncbi:BON domain-containing protein [Desulfotignum balticum]|uniref:BON domain-containing protein n=1 Tax=Desulfotignum balticum TaxID=115781 RepID=UPI00040A14D1|nr:BON domain-containing protein [Desulfotignum balticum]
MNLTQKIKEKKAANTADFQTKIEILLKLAVIPDLKILAPRVSVKNGTVTLGGIVDAFWKSSYIENILASELPNRHVKNNLTVAMACFLDSSCQAAHEKELNTGHGSEKTQEAVLQDRMSV